MAYKEWNWQFYGLQWANGNKPVQEWFDGLPEDAKEELRDTIRHLQHLPYHLWKKPQFDRLAGQRRFVLTLRPTPTESTDIAGQKDLGSLSFSYLETTKKPERFSKERGKQQSDLALSSGGRQPSTDLNSIERLIERLKRGPKDRAQFVDSHINKGIAYQIRALRDRQGTQPAGTSRTYRNESKRNL